MEREPLFERLNEEVGLPRRTALRVFRTIVGALAPWIPHELRDRLGARVPELQAELAGVLVSASLMAPASPPALSALTHGVAVAAELEPGAAREVTQVACRLLGALLDEDAHSRLRLYLDDAVARLLAPAEPSSTRGRE